MKNILVIGGLIILVLFLVNFDEDEAEKYNLSISKEGEGKIYFDGEESEYESGEEIKVNAKAVIGYKFDRWSGDIDSTDSEIEIIIDQDKDITAHFVKEEAEETDRMVLVEAGTTSENNGSVTIENDFYISKYHVTQAEFEEVMGFNPSYFNDEDHPNLKGDTTNRPVEDVTWYDAIKYANQLSEAEGLEKYYDMSDIEYYGDNIDDAEVTENEGANGYRLATEDEHEYAARGGKDGNATTYAGSDNLDEVGWYNDNSDLANSEFSSLPGESKSKGTMPVAEKEANELGLYDMSGNVYDWTNTPLGSHRVTRGGSWLINARRCEMSSSGSNNPSLIDYSIGFRLARRF